mmetsp:Transcript_3515/g.22085  ORF Transcript_3515/g.22085 Transcript_3515/m.22085 type:complete len:217 (+) Transcript_3515:2250-2900(+)
MAPYFRTCVFSFGWRFFGFLGWTCRFFRVSCFSTHVRALVHGLGRVRSFCSLTHRMCISTLPHPWVACFRLVAFRMSRSVGGTFSLFDSHSFVPLIDEQLLGQARFSVLEIESAPRFLLRPFSFAFCASLVEYVCCIVFSFFFVCPVSLLLVVLFFRLPSAWCQVSSPFLWCVLATVWYLPCVSFALHCTHLLGFHVPIQGLVGCSTRSLATISCS